MYIERHIEKAMEKAFRSFPAVLLTGPRQVGKSTILREKYGHIPYVLLDNPTHLQSLLSDPLGFLGHYGTPLSLDEIQRAGEAFVSLKYMIDSDRHPGMYILSGSQRYNLMQGVSESLAGRVGIINLLGLSQRELEEDTFNEPFLPVKAYFEARKPIVKTDEKKLWKRIHIGSMPELYSNSEVAREMFYGSFVSTYIERDVRQLLRIGDELSFMQFMTAAAARTGQLLNMSDMAKDVGISPNTAKSWLSVLQASGLVYLLRPFSLNAGKRAVKTPKLYFTDTGLVSYLCKWPNPETLESGAMAGQIYETYVISEILKSYYNAGEEPNMYFFRDSDGVEVDILFFAGDTLYPLEIKKTATPSPKDFRHFNSLKSIFPTMKIQEGGVLCNIDGLLPFGDGRTAIPLAWI